MVVSTENLPTPVAPSFATLRLCERNLKKGGSRKGAKAQRGGGCLLSKIGCQFGRWLDRQKFCQHPLLRPLRLCAFAREIKKRGALAKTLRRKGGTFFAFENWLPVRAVVGLPENLPTPVAPSFSALRICRSNQHGLSLAKGTTRQEREGVCF